MKEPRLIHDKVEPFATTHLQFGVAGIFHLRVLQLSHRRRPVAICGELTDNRGPFIGNALECVVERCGEVLGNRRFELIEYCPYLTSPHRDASNYSRVRLTWSLRGRLLDAGFEPSVFDLSELLGVPIELRTWCVARYTAKTVGGRDGQQLRDDMASEVREAKDNYLARVGEHIDLKEYGLDLL